ncbi:hypothetical protein ACFOKF_25465 [Sphingobium rhizovicinum]|uniref:Uncharacterized protein n=1 Tax=Sphingobium rhizovicinum TaxID=432308 RepID=A0ABV7NPZ6_9SPHN
MSISTVTTEAGGSLTQFAPFTTIPVTNPFIPNDLRTLLASRADPSARSAGARAMSASATKDGTKITGVQQYLGGLKGTIGGSWKFRRLRFL